ncbi:MAG: amino acid ABC transporter permease [Clostridia bacterium]
MSKWDLFIRQFIERGAYNDVLDGLRATIEIAVLGLVIGIVIGTIIAVIKVIPGNRWPIRVLNGICKIYVELFRGTPMVVQLLLGYWVLMPALGLSVSSIVAAIVIFGLNSGAYVSEIMRSGINSVDFGQLEAGRAVGMSYTTTMSRVVVPQAVKNILPTLGNEFITLIKDTSIVSFIAVVDLTKSFRSIASANYEFVVPYLILAAIYLVLVMMISTLVKLLERRFGKSDRKN